MPGFLCYLKDFLQQESSVMPIDYKKYPPNWLTEIRPRILERANNCCEKCKVPNYAIIDRGIFNGIPCYQDMDGNIFNAENGEKVGENYLGSLEKPRITKVILTIAHLDHDKENHSISDERLRAWCQRCHLMYDMPNHVAKRKATLEKRKGIQSLF